MNFKIKFAAIVFVLGNTILINGCKDGDLLTNPNASTRATPSLVLNNLTSNLVMAEEKPFAGAHRINQYLVSNTSYYWGTNFYNWTNTTHRYDILRYAVKLEEEATRQYGSSENVYLGLAKFFRAYSGIWLSQRVGDIPFQEAGDPENLTPKFDSQKEVYLAALAYLEDANTIFSNLIARNMISANTLLDEQGDIFRLTNGQWQKVINAFRLRILVSLSKRAGDNPDLEVAQKIASILADRQKNPLMENNTDNMVYRFNQSYNPYPAFNSRPYSYGIHISKTLLDLTTLTQDPRTFVFATPAPAQYNRLNGKAVNDFSAYVGASTNETQAVLFAQTDTRGGSTAEDRGAYSYINNRRYFGSQDGSTTEHYILFSYAEMCFNIAEAIHRKWTPGNAEECYLKGIHASLQVYGLQHGAQWTVGDRLGQELGKVTIDINSFLAHPEVKYKGSNEQGLKQIISQKYIAFFCQSGYEAFYNWLRTGYPEFQQGGPGIGTADNQIVRRWMYPEDEISYNHLNYVDAISRQYNGKDITTVSTWLFK
ncbi:SusD/RagB family nutrient-binding outer membrane lipoprotein [Sphingobacterium oryzagri]|uniref:SusD/RagB family nutrient-binding outer membrane lipoprotein n=1 Tax=Sphingobacterium oryzagri TaxID=3025669 RepID=A0ABY7WHJ1_9SPHI|nr:SusD/RagB family nutrient-binding outer membrane lipoprotein [Sphingobacterium sp. KACC 22765]WDF68648.1 SusD/RagB family nutrient-binding outer membrane lipoprotein [Sphingobacterium sp. KACC 22765]